MENKVELSLTSKFGNILFYLNFNSSFSVSLEAKDKEMKEQFEQEHEYSFYDDMGESELNITYMSDSGMGGLELFLSIIYWVNWCALNCNNYTGEIERVGIMKILKEINKLNEY